MAPNPFNLLSFFILQTPQQNQEQPQNPSNFISYTLSTPQFQFLHPLTALAFSTLIYPLTRLLRPFTRPNPPRRRLAEPGCAVPLFRPYVARVPWHGGARAILSAFFPRYGHYCGPNWSSGKDGGSMLWDRRPIDWLDFCCYCHDIGYDTHDQGKLLSADIAFLQCLEKPKMATKGGAYAALVYRAMCVAGLRSILIPYRTFLVNLQTGPSIFEVVGNMFGKVTTSDRIEPQNRKEML